MSTSTIIALDLGRHKSVACVYDRGTRAHAFRDLDTTPGALDRLLSAHPGAAVVIEACANAGWVHDRAVAAGHPVKVANTAAEAWKFKHLKRKTDRDDARRLAELEAIGQLPTVAMPDPATRQRRILIACRQERCCWRRSPGWAGAVAAQRESDRPDHHTNPRESPVA